jgi:ribosomal protein S14
MPNSRCERCGERPHSWFTDGGYICNVCMDEWHVIERFLIANVMHIGASA